MNCLSHKASFYFTAKHKNITSWRIKSVILFRADHIKWQSMIGFETKKMEKSCFSGDRFSVFFDLYMEGYIKTTTNTQLPKCSQFANGEQNNVKCLISTI